MPNDLVSYSRAGDVFHYRWAARRCLKMIHPNSLIELIVIEGSNEDVKAGEYVIDVAEYSGISTSEEKINYYQLKHTSVQLNKPFTIGDLKGTFIGFAEKFRKLRGARKDSSNNLNANFIILTNRTINTSFKQKIKDIAENRPVDKGFLATIEKYTQITSNELALFCKLIKLEDGEGDYRTQKDELRVEIANLVAGSVANDLLDTIVALVQEKVLPHSNGKITQEEVLWRFGVTSKLALYPAPVAWEELGNIIDRRLNGTLQKTILDSSSPIIIHATGGVGKTVFCRQFLDSIPEESFGIVYDCFGAGRYRNRSSTRHRHRDALVQIVNELASQGLCLPLIVQNTTLDEDIMREFLTRIDQAVKTLRQSINTASLFILIDAADNAEMAAKEFNQPCFAHELLREQIPEGCKLVMLCRTERISLLKPPSYIPNYELPPFNQDETLENLKCRFPNANDKDSAEFHRLTYGNPRVQANALDVRASTIKEVLEQLDPSGVTVEKQIEQQLEMAVLKIKSLFPELYTKNIDDICLGLASLPPNIPLNILATSTGVDISLIKSFLADIGRPLWLSNESVQFKDEPTETWFRKTFVAKKNDFQNYIGVLEPIASHSTYVAEALPLLYLQAGDYTNLIEVALSDEFLPEYNPIDTRNVRVSRLQFAFKASLKSNQYTDAIKLALRAGEETAGNQRQLSLLQKNLDLLVSLSSEYKVHEIAFKRLLKREWPGSENIYIASLLSGLKEYQGEARVFLRASRNWLNIYFSQLQEKKDLDHRDSVDDADILELAYIYLNLDGTEGCFNFLKGIRSKEAAFRIVQGLTERLIDLGRFNEVTELLQNSVCDPYFVVAIVSELILVGQFPDASHLEKSLDLLCHRRCRITKPSTYQDSQIISAILSFIEVCICRRFPTKKILRVLRHYVPLRSNQLITSMIQSVERTIYLKSLAIRTVLTGKLEIDFDEILPRNLINEKHNYGFADEIKKFKEVVNGLLPWFQLRTQILLGEEVDLLNVTKVKDRASKEARRTRSTNYDTLPDEIAAIITSILILYNQVSQAELVICFDSYLKNNVDFRIIDRLNFIRAVYRAPHLSFIGRQVEDATYELLKSYRHDGPDEIAQRFIALSRAVLIASRDDSRVYFDEAVDVVSKFGDEINERWDAISALAQQTCTNQITQNELAYRFIRCAELVGENSYEKDWDRNESIRICARMSYGVGISALSRWRDRDVGNFERQLKGLLKKLVSSKAIKSSVGWAMVSFFSYHQLNDFLSICLEKEGWPKMNQKILDDAVHLLELEGADKGSWEKLKTIAGQFQLNNEKLNLIADFLIKQKEISTGVKNTASAYEITKKTTNVEWNEIFNELITYTEEGFDMAIQRFENLKERTGVYFFIEELINRTDEKYFWELIDVVLKSDKVSYFELRQILNSLPREWKNKISVKRKWPEVMHQIGQRYAYVLAERNSFEYFVTNLDLEPDSIVRLKEGIFSGLADDYEFADANVFFGFVSLVSSFIQPGDAIYALDFGLSRFEIHMDDDFGDGPWGDWLKISDNIDVNIAGFIWSALGSPRSAVRWNAAHCIVKLADFNCTEILDALIDWLSIDQVKAFGSSRFSFYNLHARLYLLIALARISSQQPDLLAKYSKVFSKFVVSEDHLLIQQFSSKIVMNLAKSFPGLYKNEDLRIIQSIDDGMGVFQEEEYSYEVESPWHKNGELDSSINFYSGWDFERYWFEPLGRIFGLSGKQVQEIVANIIVKEWGIEKKGYKEDTRANLWERSSHHEQETWHDHGRYPKTDSWDFYLSYHAMFIVAARLLERMPIILKNEWYDNERDEWEQWLSTHITTPPNCKWLADYRRALPLKRPNWILEEKSETWQTDIIEEDFVNCVKTEDQGIWLIVNGGWYEKHNERTESYSISSALVSVEASEALLAALATCNDPYNFCLPAYKEDRLEIDFEMFQLQGWIKNQNPSSGVDSLDPYAQNIYFPPYMIGDTIKDQLRLSVCDQGQVWRAPKFKEVIMVCETWSSYESYRTDKPDQSGMRLKASIPFLKYLCKTLDCNLIFAVRISRNIDYKYRKDGEEYSKPLHQIFIFSANGELRTTRASYQFG